ncbi:Fe2+-dependent dioxygenase [Siccirubricoccus sp. KC 17139]|uniref:Fe2+-dependent dioxygenase n=1 Tax=Siccirubricoccus soli TaxID=2899147 RepID=A0ABT1DDT7_9PROT|nr:Fe2+-dependent dioxygenase [Siccirubricoccus soli]MCO6419130.1 Fe2+-dependent dioxygenase [Siccirubricoccus soli]MCP2685265.1 Fe2+-dependent dioxygenase [Siccirubricoccus soli]
MILPIAGLLDAATLERLRVLLAGARFGDGRRTAGWAARGAKQNEQAAPADPAVREAAGIVSAALLGHELFRAAALPRRLRPVMFARYAGAGAYGSHMDDALMGLADPAGPLRTDLSVTVFLSAPEAYEGGELVIEGVGGEAEYKLPSGCALVYPAATLHRVAPVTAGERLVAVTWAQSLVREDAARELLFDLDRARRAVFAREGDGETFRLLAKTHGNLLRRWAET